MSSKRTGYVAIIGRPNVGKSTLLNHFLGEKLSITSRKPQTTRHKILGIKTVDENVQIIYVDTPGIHQQAPYKLNQYMNKVALLALVDVDVVVFVVEGTYFNAGDEWVLRQLKKTKVPVILAVNKVDMLANKEVLLPHLQKLSGQYPFAQIVPMSARTGFQLDRLERAIIEYLPPCEEFYFSITDRTDRSDKFLASEVVREKLMRNLGQELPYATTVGIEIFERTDTLLTISAVIWVERESQKPIVIGSGGTRLKMIGTQARIALERLFKTKVMLKLW
ncbi:MAG TPA: GTPase Era, partial [Gammaproteobacteria bacterium]|nr:GTPase Era [Gammaproteobacteria bacterium]